MRGKRGEEVGKGKDRVSVRKKEQKPAQGVWGLVKSWGLLVGGGRSTDQHFPQAWAQACETTNVLENLSWDLLRTNAVMC